MRNRICAARAAQVVSWVHRSPRKVSDALPSCTLPDRFLTRSTWVVSARCAMIG